MAVVEHKFSRIALILIALAGMVIMGYLVSLHFSPDNGSFCDLGEGLSCDIVNKSIYSAIFGIPLSVLGFLYFLGVGVAVFWKFKAAVLQKIVWLSIAFLGPSLYLTYIEFSVIKNVCVFCEASKVLILAIILISIWALRPVKISLSSVGAAVLAGLVLAFLTYFIHSQAIPTGKYTSFARCLYEKGMRMYGSMGCSFCARQRELFGDAVKEIHEIECDPRYPDAQVELCVAKNIKKTPTWIMEDAGGGEIFRFDPGVQTLERLGEVAGCSLPE